MIQLFCESIYVRSRPPDEEQLSVRGLLITSSKVGLSKVAFTNSRQTGTQQQANEFQGGKQVSRQWEKVKLPCFAALLLVCQA